VGILSFCGSITLEVYLLNERCLQMCRILHFNETLCFVLMPVLSVALAFLLSKIVKKISG
ncbi:MAG: hypothetical protein II728_07935, partial [Bacteroidaceae bacterium]|nr:hypothetical protein [Bacteroidaceae bacterium]